MESMLENGDENTRAPSTASTAGFDVLSRSVKRPRPVKSCTECRQRKLKCDRQETCTQCLKSQRTCKYANQEHGAGSDTSDVETTERPVKRSQHLMPVRDGELHHPLAQQEGREQPPKALPGLEEIVARLERLETVVLDQGSTTHHAPPPPMVPQGRPAKGRPSSQNPGEARIQTLLSLFDEADGVLVTMAKTDLLPSLRNAYHALKKEHQKALEPITVFVDSMLPIHKRMADILPPRPACDRLVDLYFVTSEGLYRILHIPSFQQEYAQYWAGKGCSDSFLPRLLCVLCIAAWLGTDSRGLGHDRSTNIHAPTACVLVRQYLDDLRRKQVINLPTIQTELLLLQALKTTTPDQQSTWTQLGYIVRMAMTMNLHHDPSSLSNPTLTPFTSEHRRRLWFTILEMDLDASLAINLPCAVRPGEYSCLPPSNIDDTALLPTTTTTTTTLPDPTPLDCHTKAHLQAHAARTLPLRMHAAAAALVSADTTLPGYEQALALGAELEAVLRDINTLFPPQAAEHKPPPDNGSESSRRRGRAQLNLQVRRTLMALYRPFFTSAGSRVAMGYLGSCMVVLGFVEEERGAEILMVEDVVEAGLGVCWFIEQAVSGGDNCALAGEEGGWDSLGWDRDGILPSSSSSTCPWSVAAMVQAVERAFDWLVGVVVRLDSGGCGYLRDVVALGVVLEAVQLASQQQKAARSEARLRRILQVCLQRVNISNHISLTPASHGLLGGRLKTESYGKIGGVDGWMTDRVADQPFTWNDLFRYWDPPIAQTDGI